MGCQHGRAIAECPDARCRDQENTLDDLAHHLALMPTVSVDGRPQRFVCPDCGYAVKADEDGCCATCGRDCAIVIVVAEPEDMDPEPTYKESDLNARIVELREALANLIAVGMAVATGRGEDWFMSQTSRKDFSKSLESAIVTIGKQVPCVTPTKER